MNEDKFCKFCGKQIENDFEVCPYCGAATDNKIISEKSGLTCLLLLIFLGWLGAHRFYVGKIGTAILYIITFGGVGIWALIDLISIILGNFKDAEGKYIKIKGE